MPDSLISGAPEQTALVLEQKNGPYFHVQLEDGSQVIARVPKRTLREMFAIRPGDRLRVIERVVGEYRILGFDRTSE